MSGRLAKAGNFLKLAGWLARLAIQVFKNIPSLIIIDKTKKRSQVWPTSVNLTGLAGIAAFSLSLTLTLNLAKKVGRPQKKSRACIIAESARYL